MTKPKKIKVPESPILPFAIVIDTNESAPYSFTGIASDADQRCDGLPWIVPVMTAPLWAKHRIPIELNGKDPVMKGMADYSIEGLEDLIQVERKSVADLYSTLGQRRHEFECEIARLNRLPFAAVVIEGDWKTIIVDHGMRSALNPKTVARTILSWSIKYPNVHWFTCMDRRHAELMTFNILRLFWRQRQQEATRSDP